MTNEPMKANLGLATTAQLLDEIRARIEVDYHAGGGGLEYTTVRGRPATQTKCSEGPRCEDPNCPDKSS